MEINSFETNRKKEDVSIVGQNKKIGKCENVIAIHAITQGLGPTVDFKDETYFTKVINDLFFGDHNKSDRHSFNNKTKSLKKKPFNNDYIENRENILKLTIFQLWQSIKYETEKQSKGYQRVQYVSTQNNCVFLQNPQQTIK